MRIRLFHSLSRGRRHRHGATRPSLIAASLTVGAALLVPTAAASPGAPPSTAGSAASDERALPPEHERALFASTYRSLLERVDERGYAATSLTGYYDAMYTRDASVNALALLLGGDDREARAILRYILRYSVAAGVESLPHRIWAEADELAPDGQQTATDSVAASLGGQRTSAAQAMPAPGMVTAVDLFLGRSQGATGRVVATLMAGQGVDATVVDRAAVSARDLTPAGGWFTFRFLPPMFDEPPTDGYTIRLTTTGTAPDSIHWYGDAPGGVASYRERVHDFTISGYDGWDETDEKYSILLVWARYVAKHPGDAAFIDETWPHVRRFADYYLTRPGYLSDNLDLIRNPILDDEGYHETYDLLTNVVTAQALHELAPVAAGLGDAAAAARWRQAAERISGGIDENLVTSVDGKSVYGEKYEVDEGNRFYAGWSFVNLAPVAFSWYALDPQIMANTVAAYLEHESRSWSGMQMLSSMQDYAFTWHNDWVLTKGLAWEWAWAAQSEDDERVGVLDQYLRTYYPDTGKPISEGWILDSDGHLRVTDPGNQEHAAWFAVMMLQTYPGLSGHPGRCAVAGDADPASLVTLDVVPVDDVVSEGESSTVDVTLANKTCDPLTDASLTLRAPAGWTVQPASADVGDVEAQGQTTATFIVQAPDDAASDDPIATAELTAHASYDARGTVPDSAAATGALSVAQTVQPPFRTFRSTEAYWGQAGDRFAIYAGGRDMSGSVDQYGTIYRDAAAPPDARAEVTVTSQGDTGPWAKAGLVMRNDATGRSAGYVVVAVTPDNGFVLQWDADGNGYLDGGRSTLKAGSTQYPVRLRLERHGTAYTGSYRLESQDWQSIGTVTVPGGSPAQDVGMVASAVNALNPDTISQVEYDHFTLDP